MRKIVLSLFVLLCFFAAHGQNFWTYDMYEGVNYKNFRDNSLFSQEIDKENPDIPLINAALFFLVNEERAKRGIEPVPYHPMCEIAAYHHSVEMEKNESLGHYNLYNEARNTTRARARLAGIANPVIAENVLYRYYGDDDSYLELASAMIGQWMKSKPHRKNILSVNNYAGGCGVSFSKGRLVYATQVFQWYKKIKSQKRSDRLPNLKNGKAADYPKSY